MGGKVWHRTPGGGNEGGPRAGMARFLPLSRRTDSRRLTNDCRQSPSAGGFMALPELSTAFFACEKSRPRPPFSSCAGKFNEAVQPLAEEFRRNHGWPSAPRIEILHGKRAEHVNARSDHRKQLSMVTVVRCVASLDRCV